MNPNQQTQNIVPGTPQSTEPQYDYIGPEVQIGAGRFGMKPLAQHGTIIIDGGNLWLLGSQDQVIAQAPLAMCTVTKGPWLTMGQMAWLTIQGARYSVAVGHGKTLGRKARKGVFITRRYTKDFLAAFQRLRNLAQASTPQ
ncbi:MAG TPA: hypothetical protein VLG16_04355 [Candidatus Saccharimonadales bacterium]|nr:hypothetical protein [Candidatus Saccharimonadales bacterium]